MFEFFDVFPKIFMWAEYGLRMMCCHHWLPWLEVAVFATWFIWFGIVCLIGLPIVFLVWRIECWTCGGGCGGIC